MAEGILPSESIRKVDLSVAHPDGHQVKIPSEATGVVVIRRDAPCELWRTQSPELAIDAPRATVVQNTGWRSGDGEFQPAVPLESVWVFNAAASAGDELVLASFVGLSLRQGQDRFSEVVFPPAPVKVYEEQTLALANADAETRRELFNDFPVETYRELHVTAQEQVAGTSGDNEADYLRLVIELYDEDGVLLETITESLYEQADGGLSGADMSGSAVGSHPDMYTADAYILHKDGVGGGSNGTFTIDAIVAFGVS